MSAAFGGYAVRDPDHDRHTEVKEWIAEDFDSNIIDAGWLGEQVPQSAHQAP
jgi:hypothetical protein